MVRRAVTALDTTELNTRTRNRLYLVVPDERFIARPHYSTLKECPMNPPYQVKITLVKKTFHADLVSEFTTRPNQWEKGSIGENANCCHAFDIGHEFISDETHMPEGFPDPPWVDIQKYVFILGRGENMVGVHNGIFVTNCSDGFRPITFKLERIEQ